MKAILITQFLWGLTSGFSHCIGMCGIFVLACSNLADTSTTKSHSNVVAQTLFHVGRTIVLVALGAVAAALGSLGGFREHVPHLQGYMEIGAGILLALFSLGQIGIVPRLRIPEPNVMEIGGGRIRRLYAGALSNRSIGKPLLIGMLVGALPCGLTYYALIPVLMGSFTVLQGILAMTLFSVSTAVGLITLGLAAGTTGAVLRGSAIRNRLASLSGVVMVVMAGILIWRGVAFLHSL